MAHPPGADGGLDRVLANLDAGPQRHRVQWFGLTLPSRVVQKVGSSRLSQHGLDFLTDVGTRLGQQCGTRLCIEVDCSICRHRSGVMLLYCADCVPQIGYRCSD